MKRLFTLLFVGLMLFGTGVENTHALSSSATMRERAAERAARRRGQQRIRVLRTSVRRPSRRELRRAQRTQLPTYRTQYRLRAAERRKLREQKVQVRLRGQAPITPEVVLREEILRLTNIERAKEGLPPFKRNALLERSAQEHADDLIRRNFFSHTNPDNESPTDRIKKTDYLDITFENCNCKDWRFVVGENIAKGQRTPEEVIENWMGSDSHRAAILHKVFDEIGIGISGNAWAQNFGAIIKTPRE